jgi:hypothetical protein
MDLTWKGSNSLKIIQTVDDKMIPNSMLEVVIEPVKSIIKNKTYVAY